MSDTLIQSKKQRKHKRNTSGLIPFKKRDPVTGAIDPRINTKGRPQHFDDLRRAFLELLKPEWDVEINGKKVPRHIAIGLALSSDKKYMREFLEYAVGKVPQAVDVTSGGEPLKVIIEYADTTKQSDTATDKDNTPEPTSGASEDQSGA